MESDRLVQLPTVRVNLQNLKLHNKYPRSTPKLNNYSKIHVSLKTGKVQKIIEFVTHVYVHMTIRKTLFNQRENYSAGSVISFIELHDSIMQKKNEENSI